MVKMTTKEELADIIVRSVVDYSSCPICLEIYRSPLITLCGHTFCEVCVRECVKRGKYKCPICIRDDMLRINNTVRNIPLGALLDLLTKVILEKDFQTYIQASDKSYDKLIAEHATNNNSRVLNTKRSAGTRSSADNDDIIPELDNSKLYVAQLRSNNQCTCASVNNLNSNENDEINLDDDDSDIDSPQYSFIESDVSESES